MASRPILPVEQIITNGNMASASITSIPSIISNTSMVSYDISWSGTSPVGTVDVQISNTYKQNADGSVAVAGNWTSLTLSTPFSISGNTGFGMINLSDLSSYAIRIVYTKTSGVGTLNAYIAGKVQ